MHPTIKLKPKEGRRARAGAPWIFSNEIQMDAAAKALPAGSIVNVAGDDGQPFGTGYFNAKSLISGAPAGSRGRHDHRHGLLRAPPRARACNPRCALCASPSTGWSMPRAMDCRASRSIASATRVVAQITTAGMERLIDPLLAALEKTVAPAERHPAQRYAVARARRA